MFESFTTAVIIVLVIFQISSANCIEFNQVSCDLRETVNISSGFIDDQGHYHHNGLIYRSNMFAEFDFVIVNGTARVGVERHFRGCVCELKKCVRICRYCKQEESADEACVRSSKLKVPINSGSAQLEISLNDDGEFVVLEGKSCEKMFILDPFEDPLDEWDFDDGVINLINYNESLDHNSYCFVQVEMEDEPKKYRTEVHQCAPENGPSVKEKIYNLGMLISLPFLAITFLIYALTSELRNLHGKCLMCYIIGLKIFYVAHIVAVWNRNINAETLACKTLGYMIFVGVHICFFWLNVMCYDIWSAFKVGMRQHGKDTKRFICYCLYAFGVPLAFLLVIYTIDLIDGIPESFKPLIGVQKCYIQDSRLVEAIYVYIPISIILTVNIILYSITAYTIYRVQKETAVIKNGESQKHSARMESDRDKFFLYLRLFIVMGVTWIMESISFIFKSHYIFYATDVMNCLQGLFIFILFVWTPKVKKILLKRYRPGRNFPTFSSSTKGFSVSRKSEESTRISTIRHSTYADCKSKCEQPMISSVNED